MPHVYTLRPALLGAFWAVGVEHRTLVNLVDRAFCENSQNLSPVASS